VFYAAFPQLVEKTDIFHVESDRADLFYTAFPLNTNRNQAQQTVPASATAATAITPRIPSTAPKSTLRVSKRVVAHPTGRSMQPLPLPIADGPLAMLQTVENNVASFMWEAVLEGSKTTYQTGYNHFCRYASAIGSDRFLMKVPDAFLQLQQPQPHSWFLFAMLGFLTYLRVNVAVTPGTVSTYCSGVRFFLINSGVDVREMDTSVVMKAVRTGMHKAYRSMPGNAKSERSTLPYAADMIVVVRNNLCSSLAPEQQSREQLAKATAIVFAFILLARISEYIVTSSNHYIRGKHITFLLHSGVLINSSQAYLHSIDEVAEMQATIKDSKNDEDGMGHKFTYQKRSSEDPGLFCIVTEMFRCASVLQPGPDTAFFAWKGDASEPAWVLSEHSINKLLQDGAKLFGFDPSKFSSHSLRIGGASALAAAGAPSWVIQLTGRWMSLAFLQYIRLASTAFQRSLVLQTDGTTFTAKHIALWNPGVLI